MSGTEEKSTLKGAVNTRTFLLLKLGVISHSSLR